MAKLPPRLKNGDLPAYAWPGGYPLYYLDAENNVLCPTCANKDTDPSQAPKESDVNWEDASLHCDDCGQRIASAYAEDDADDDDGGDDDND